MTPTPWKTYPFALSTTDAQLTFPAAEGDQGAESNTFYVAGRLRGVETGRQFGFLVIFTFNNIRQRLRADFYTLALFDLDAGTYGTFSEFDLPRPPRIRRAHKLSVARGHLDVAFASVEGCSAWTTRRDAEGRLVPFCYTVSLFGRDAEGRIMHVALDLDARKPPMPVGGAEYGGVKTCMGQYGTHSYFQSDVRFRGRLEWGDVREDVTGDAGWIDRQWTPRYLGAYSDRRSSRYRHEWRQIHLDNGIEMSVWRHFDRHRGNRLIPFSGATAAGPENQVLSTTEFAVEYLSFVRDPGHVPPQYPLSRGARYLADRYRLHIPAWNLDVVAEPLVPAPAHRLPVEYWSGPTAVAGNMAGRPVHGFGFNERTMVFTRDFELVDVLRSTLRHLPESACPPLSRGPLGLANLAWEIDGFLSHGDRRAALRYLHQRVRPELERFEAPPRAHLLQIADDLEAALRARW